MTCAYTVTTGKLQINNPVSAPTSGSSLSFTVTGFMNPYSGVPVTGFKISTGLPNPSNPSDPVYAIDELAVTVQVSTFAELQSVDISLVNNPITVEALA